MNLKIISFLRDNRTHCISIMAETTIAEYLGAANSIEKLNEQRDVLKTSSAITIRKRLIEDLKQGTIIPPLVLGILLDDEISTVTLENVEQTITNNEKSFTIIDGIQRTESLQKAVEQKKTVENNTLRIEFWISNNVASLIYRMLVLNTGQVPWNVRRQIEVVYKPLIKEVEKNVKGITLNSLGDNERRKKGGEYPASSIVELYMAFASKKEVLDTREKLADDFTRLDIIKMTGEQSYPKHFYTTIEMMYIFDINISKYLNPDNPTKSVVGFCNGMDLFTSMPSKVGFIVAIAQEVLGRAGSVDRSEEDQEQRMNDLHKAFLIMISHIKTMNETDLGKFLSFQTLNEKAEGLPTKKIGDTQREFFKTAFSVLIQSKFNVSSLNEAWMAY